MTRNERFFLCLFDKLKIAWSDIKLNKTQILSVCEINKNIIESVTDNNKVKIKINGIDINDISIPNILNMLGDV